MSESSPLDMITRFCEHNRIHAVGVPSVEENTYFNYYFDTETNSFEPLKCTRCQPEIKEEYLIPLYSEWSEQIQNHVIHVRNLITSCHEQYIYCRQTGGLIEVNVSKFDESKIPPLIRSGKFRGKICVIPENEHYPQVFIESRGPFGSISKWEMSLSGDTIIEVPEIYVKTLVLQELENKKTPLYPKGIKMYILGSCSHSNNISSLLWYISFSHRGEPLSFKWNSDENQFEKFNCSKCLTRPLAEDKLYLQYERFHPRTNQTVFFVVNPASFAVEQYIFNSETTGFEQVNYEDLEYDEFFERWPQTCLNYVTIGKDGEVIVIMKNEDRQILKYRKKESEHLELLPPIPLKTLNINRVFEEEEEDEKENKQEAHPEDSRGRMDSKRRDNDADIKWLQTQLETIFLGDQEASTSTALTSQNSSGTSKPRKFGSIPSFVKRRGKWHKK